MPLLGLFSKKLVREDVLTDVSVFHYINNVQKALTLESKVSIIFSSDYNHFFSVELTSEDELFNNQDDPDSCPKFFAIYPSSISYPELLVDDEDDDVTIRFIGKIKYPTKSFAPVPVCLTVASSAASVQPFYRLAVSMFWSMTNKQPNTLAPVSDIITSLHTPSQPQPPRASPSHQTPSVPSPQVSHPQTSLQQSTIKPKPPVEVKLPPLPEDPLQGKCIGSEKVQFLRWDLDSSSFVEVYSGIFCQFKLLEQPDFNYNLVLTKQDLPVLAFPITSALKFQTDPSNESMLKFAAGEEEFATLFALVFTDSDTCWEIQGQIAELTLKTDRKTTQIADLEWMVNSMVLRTPMTSGNDDEDRLGEAMEEASLVVDESDDDEGRQSSIKSGIDHDVFYTPQPLRNNAFLAGTTSGRNFLLRDGDVSVVPFNPDGTDFDLSSSTSVVPQYKGEILTPSRGMLRQRDGTMLLMDDSKPNSVFSMDLERGEVVSEFTAKVNDVDMKIGQVTPMKKFSQFTDDQTFGGLNSTRTLVWDPREGKNAVRGMGYQYGYSTKPQLSCMATTSDGQVVVGSKKGEIRLFSGLENKRAKTSIPGWGKAIIAIDTSSDGHYVLVTCEDYLMLIDTQLPEGDTGFNKRMGKDKPLPIKIQLDPDDVAKMGGIVKFTPAKFDKNAIGERVILTSTKRWTVTFNLPAILHLRNGGKLPQGIKHYSVISFKNEVVDDSFIKQSNRQFGVMGEKNLKMFERKTRK
ncbi:hypothetical protein GEMRC1_006773 [Eukaryota sp. GEM-RC1]